MKTNKTEQKVNALFKECISKFKAYALKYDVSLYFAIHCLDMMKNAAKTQNKNVLKEFINIFDIIPYNKKLEKEILNSIRY